MKKFLAFLLLFVGISLSSAESSRVLKFHITDESGEPMIGVTICEKGMNNCTSTDIDGNAELTLRKLPTTIVISLIGYETVEIEIKKISKVLELSLVDDDNVLDESAAVDYSLTW